MKDSKIEEEDRRLGLNQDITRRDFLKGTLIGSGAMLLNMPAPGLADSAASARSSAEAAAWDGYAGVGDYTRSNGNTFAVREAAHLIRDGKVDAMLSTAVELGESFDVIIAGGGFAGTSAARTFLRESKKDQTCLVLENHALVGGEAKRNEFIVNGHRLIGPQGSNLVIPPTVKGDSYDELWNDLGIPRNPSFQILKGYDGDLRIARENFFPMFGLGDQIPSSGYYFDKKTFGGTSYWDLDSQRTGFRHTAFPEAVKADLRRLTEGTGKNLGGERWEQWLDSMTYADYLESVLGIQAETTKLFDASLCLEGGLGADCVSALFALKVAQPGFDKGFPEGASLYRLKAERPEDLSAFSFPGGNDAVYRLLLKKVIPEAIAGGSSFVEIHNGAYQFGKFDQPGSPVRIRLQSTVVHVVYDGPPENSKGVIVTYHRDGKLYRVRAKGFVSALGGWVNKRIVQELPDQYVEAFGRLNYGSAMIVNIALTNWRFLAKLGFSAAHYFMNNGLGQCANIRRPMVFEDYQPPLNPNQPIVLTSYIGFSTRGLSAREQAAKARWELLSKSYRDYEISIRRHLTELFSSSGFNAKRDIAGITLNRWGHSYVVPEPGFYFGMVDRPATSEILKKRTGRLAFGHSELNGVQEWFGGVENGERAMRQVLEVVT
jgi:spermidine dehydrogenase